MNGNDAYISIRNVSKSFGTFQAIDDLSLDIAGGEFFSLLGASGSGKTTLLSMLAGFEPATKGEIYIDGQPMSSVPPNHRPVNTVFQNYAIFPHLTVGQNIMLSPRITQNVPQDKAETLAREVLAQVGLSEKFDSYPDNLSGGQQQRVAIARSLAMRPKVMLFDEVTSALDPELTGEVLLVMEKLAKDGMTMLLVTHEMSFARNVASTTVFMHQGKIWESGPSQELFANPQTPELRNFVSAGSK